MRYVRASTIWNFWFFAAVDLSSGHILAHHQLLTEEKVLEMIESAYPNPLSLPDIAAYVTVENDFKFLDFKTFFGIF